MHWWKCKISSPSFVLALKCRFIWCMDLNYLNCIFSFLPSFLTIAMKRCGTHRNIHGLSNLAKLNQVHAFLLEIKVLSKCRIVGPDKQKNGEIFFSLRLNSVWAEKMHTHTQAQAHRERDIFMHLNSSVLFSFVQSVLQGGLFSKALVINVRKHRSNNGQIID